MSARLIQALTDHPNTLRVVKRISGEVVVRFDRFRTMDKAKGMLVDVAIPSINLAHGNQVDLMTVDGVTREALLKHSNLSHLLARRHLAVVDG